MDSKCLQLLADSEQKEARGQTPGLPHPPTTHKGKNTALSLVGVDVRGVLSVVFVVGFALAGWLAYGDNSPCHGATGLRVEYCMQWAHARGIP